MRKICTDDGMPDRGTVVRWMLSDAAFAAKCARAREEQTDLMDDRVLDTVDKVERGELEPDAARVIISGVCWRAEKLKPKKYGSKVELEHTGNVFFVEGPAVAASPEAWLNQYSNASAFGAQVPDPNPPS